MAFSLGGFLQNIGFPLLSLASIPGQQQRQDRYQRDVDRQIANAYGIAGQVGPQTLNTYDDSANRQLMELLGLRPRQQQMANDLVSGFQDRYNTAREDIANYGRQQEQDINQYFDRAEAAETGRRQERGLGSTTALNSLGNLVTTQRSAEQRRLGEDLQRFRRSILDQLSADTLGARQFAMGTDAQNTGNIANFYGGNAANRSNIVNQGLGSYLNTILGINYMPPAPNPYPGMAGQGMVETPNLNQNSWAPWLQAGGQIGGAGLGAYLASL